MERPSDKLLNQVLEELQTSLKEGKLRGLAVIASYDEGEYTWHLSGQFNVGAAGLMLKALWQEILAGVDRKEAQGTEFLN